MAHQFTVLTAGNRVIYTYDDITRIVLKQYDGDAAFVHRENVTPAEWEQFKAEGWHQHPNYQWS